MRCAENKGEDYAALPGAVNHVSVSARACGPRPEPHQGVTLPCRALVPWIPIFIFKEKKKRRATPQNRQPFQSRFFDESVGRPWAGFGDGGGGWLFGASLGVFWRLPVAKDRGGVWEIRLCLTEVLRGGICKKLDTDRMWRFHEERRHTAHGGPAVRRTGLQQYAHHPPGAGGGRGRRHHFPTFQDQGRNFFRPHRQCQKSASCRYPRLSPEPTSPYRNGYRIVHRTGFLRVCAQKSHGVRPGFSGRVQPLRRRRRSGLPLHPDHV